MSNPYDVERSFPPYFLEHRALTVDRAGTYRCGQHPVWTVHCPEGLLGNGIVIEGDDGLIVYDTGVNMDAGRKIAAEIRKISDKPVRAVFYSHHHADHVNGTAAIVDPADVASGAVKVYAWENFERELKNEFSELLQRQAMGSGYYGGAFLPPEDQHHHGIGLLPTGGTSGYIPPTDVFTEDTVLDICGVRIEVFYTGGEAISEFGLHLPDFGVVAIADEFFTGLANLHTIRGSKPREADNYLRALQRVLDIAPDWLVGSHIVPLEGADSIRGHVTKYRDAIKYFWDQSVRLINKGYTPGELQRALHEIPDELWDPPYTVPLYGSPITMLPEFFTGWVSWFDGDATELDRTDPVRFAERITELTGGVEALLTAAKADHAAGDWQLAAELAQLALRADPDNADAKLLKAAALRARGYQEINPIARSWYLTGALELEGKIDPALIQSAYGSVLRMDASVAATVRNWRFQLDSEAARGLSLAVGIRAADSDETFTVLVRNQVLEVVSGLHDADAVVLVSPSAAEHGGDVDLLEGDETAWPRLQAVIDRETVPFRMHMR